MAVWPSSIVIGREGYKETPPDRVVRNKMDIGPDKIRKRTSYGVRKLSLNLTLTTALLATFNDFYLANDSVSFTFPDPRTGSNVTARFLSTPEYNLDQTIWKVSLELEIL